MAAQTLPRMSVEAYLAYERDQEARHERVDGYLYAMTGAGDRHEEIAANLLAALHRHLQGSGCRVYGSNLKIRVGDDFYYPDLFVRCARERGDPYFKTDPVLVIEVLSPNTQRYDRGDKRLAYQSLSSLKEYALVSQELPQIEVLHRVGPEWASRRYDAPNDLLVLSSIDFERALAEIYA